MKQACISVGYSGFRAIDFKKNVMCLIDGDNFEKGFCRGVHLISVDSGPRVRLKKATIKTLEKHKVKCLWQYPDPTGERIILCPEKNKSTYLELAQQHLPEDMETGVAYRKYIYAGEPVIWDSQRRVAITELCRDNFQVQQAQAVYLVGAGLWYELWKERAWEFPDKKHQ